MRVQQSTHEHYGDEDGGNMEGMDGMQHGEEHGHEH